MRPLIGLLLLLGSSCALAQNHFFRTAGGAWKPLKVVSNAGGLSFSLSPEEIGSASTLIVLNKPQWMILEDREPPVPRKILLDGQERRPEELDLGYVAAPPRELICAVMDEKNPLAAEDVRATLNGQPLPPAQLAVRKLTPDGKQLRVAVRLATLPPGKYALQLTISDRAPERHHVSLILRFSTAPLLTNGGFELMDSEGKPLGWNIGAWSADAATKYEAGVVEGGVEGKRAFRFLGLAGSLNLVITQELEPLKPGVPYLLSGQYKSENGAAISVITSAGGQDKAEYLTHPLPPTRDWTPFSYEFTLKPHERVLIVPRTGSKGETYFDDLRLVPKNVAP